MNIKTDKRTLTGYLCAVGCEIFFGFSYLFTKQATNRATAFALLGWRFCLAFFVMGLCAFVGIVRINLKGKPLRPLLTAALFCPVIYFVCETGGISHTTVSESGVFLASIPIACLLASALILREKPKKLQVVGVLITFTGVIVTVLAAGTETSFSAVGYAMLTIAVISYALYSVSVEKARIYADAEITFVTIASGAVVFGCLAVIEAASNGNLNELLHLPLTDGAFRMSMLYQGIGCSILAFFMWNAAVSRIGVTRAASFVGVATLVSIISGVTLLRENFSLIRILGTALIITGVYTANIKK